MVKFERLPQENPYEGSWNPGTLGCAIAAGSVLILNTVIVVWVEARNGFPHLGKRDGKRTLFYGDCETTKQLNTAVHLLINLFSTILLGASNYCMQCMSAPTRAEVDLAHSQSRWVDIGVPSIKNLKHVSKTRVVLWFLLILSSLPLHVFYNSTVFSSLGANTYDVFSVSRAWADNPTAKVDKFSGSFDVYNETISGEALLETVNLSDLETLGTNDCITAYAQIYQTTRGSVFLIRSVTNRFGGDTNDSDYPLSEVGFEARNVPLNGMNDFSPYEWICRDVPTKCGATPEFGRNCDTFVPCLTEYNTDWAPFGQEYAFCLSEKITENCQLGLSIHLALVVLSMGLFKTGVMLYIALRFREKPLLTIGDAVASFLQRPDDFTQQACLAGKNDVETIFNNRRMGGQALRFSAKPVRRYRAASSTRFVVMCLCFIITSAVSLILLVVGIQRAFGYEKQSQLWKLGFGAVSPFTMIRWGVPRTGVSGLILNVAIANSPQLVFSFQYFTYNGLTTTMSLASEWSRFAHNRKGLRVSLNPKGSQRSTYFLSLPYRIGIPLMVMSGTIHWLISQSLFLVSVNAYDKRDSFRGTEPSKDLSFMTCGFSPSPIVAAVGASALFFVAIIALSLRRLKSGMPVVGSCSAAIAAACQPGRDSYKEEAAWEKVQWGVTEDGSRAVGHCGFSMDVVELPVDGQCYE
ncbi:hypothetical protein K432DRAFT_434615 [Lepidopterella palustris CBS 459.81]|uniref:DUF6536 domain-containing protein n=1 Tax=Lepidopterella palustris CBS 459.81 TaxID=1314670 RepID=A0A8E2EAY8_9PEZI|nr:hypothetical protein K432DRAFT_434615 [Lepidopterella palustris CBS 459.81]